MIDSLSSRRDTEARSLQRLQLCTSVPSFLVGDKNSKVHPDKVLKTCSTCHDGKKARMAADGFKTFPPHGNAHDFAKYPQIWIAAKGLK